MSGKTLKSRLHSGLKLLHSAFLLRLSERRSKSYLMRRCMKVELSSTHYPSMSMNGFDVDYGLYHSYKKELRIQIIIITEAL